MIAQVKIGESGLGLLEGSSSLKEHQTLGRKAAEAVSRGLGAVVHGPMVHGPWGGWTCCLSLSRLIDDLAQAITIAMLVMLPYILNLRASPHGLVTDTLSRWRKLLEG